MNRVAGERTDYAAAAAAAAVTRGSVVRNAVRIRRRTFLSSAFLVTARRDSLIPWLIR